MSKVEEAFGRLKMQLYETEPYRKDDIESYRKALDVIENTLKENQERIEELEETNNLMGIREP